MVRVKGDPSEDGSSVLLNFYNPSSLTLGSNLCLTIAEWYDLVTEHFLLPGHVTLIRGCPATGEHMCQLFHCCFLLPFLFLVSHSFLWSHGGICCTVIYLLSTTCSIFVSTLRSLLLCLMKAAVSTLSWAYMSFVFFTVNFHCSSRLTILHR